MVISRPHPRDAWMLSVRKPINVIHHANRLKDKNHTITSLDVEKAFDTIQHLFMVSLERLGVQGTDLSIVIKAICSKATATNNLHGEKLRAFTLKPGVRQGLPTTQSQ